MIKLFELQNNVVKPTVHCYNIKWLKVIMDKWPDKAIKIYAYMFYMAVPNGENPYFNYPPDLREDMLIKDLEIDFNTEEDEIIEGVEKLSKLYETPTLRAYNGVRTMIENMADYMESTKITAGRDGNITALIRLAKEFDSIRQSFKGVAKDLADEQETKVRGGQNLAYDQET